MVERIWFPDQRPPEIAEDARSLGEAMGMASGLDLSSREQLNKINRLIREDGVDSHVNRVVVCGLWIVALAALGMFIAVVVHRIRPGLWLTDIQVESLQSFLFSGGLGAGITSVSKRFLKQDKPNSASQDQ